MVAAFAGPDLWQRMTFAPSDEEAARGARVAGIAMLLFVLPMLFLAAVTLSIPSPPGVDPFVAFASSLATGQFAVPLWIQIAFAFGLLSAFLSTADTAAMLVATSLLNETGRARGTVEGTPERRPLAIPHLQAIVIVVVLLGAVLAVAAKNASLLFTGVLGILAAQGFPFLFAIWGRGKPATVLVALTFGALAALGLTFIWPASNSGYWLLLPVLPGLLCAFGKTPKVNK